MSYSIFKEYRRAVDDALLVAFLRLGLDTAKAKRLKKLCIERTRIGSLRQHAEWTYDGMPIVRVSYDPDQREFVAQVVV